MRTLIGALPPDPEPRRRRFDLGRVFSYLRQVQAECRRIVFPSGKEVLTYSAVVLACVTATTALVFALDFVFVKEVLRALL